MYLDDISSWWGISIQGLLGATSLILVTTLDDCIWLVPFVAIPPNKKVATIHAVVFVTTLTLLAILLSLVTFIFIVIGTKRRIAAGEKGEDGDASSTTTSSGMEDMELFLGSMGAGLCWILAAYLFYKRWKKWRQRRQVQQQQQQDLEQQQESSSLVAVNDYGTTTTTTTTPKETAETMEAGNAATENNDDGDNSSRPRLVISLTLLGFLDEMAYFPSLILTQVFTCSELCLGTLVAGLIMVGIVTLALAPCRPLIEWLDDHVKLYMVVTVFAIVLTLQVLLEYILSQAAEVRIR